MSLLEDARSNINKIDEEMAALFEKRMNEVDGVIRYKLDHDMQVLDTSREQSIIERNSQFITNDAYKTAYIEFLKDMMAISRKYQRSVINKDIVGYSGTIGAFAHLASMHVFPDNNKKSYATFDAVFKAVSDGDITYGVIPFENSYTGEVGEVLDLLKEHDVYIQSVYYLKISQNLLGIKGASLQDIKQVYSKDQAIYQSKQFLEGRGYDLIPYPNTALAAEFVAKEQDKTKAAIAAKENAALYDLEILAEDINTSNQNTTRFIIIHKDLVKRGNRFCMLFTVQHTSGALVNIMNIIASHGFNMENIKSRSIKDKPWEYYFYVEIEGNVNDESVKALIDEIQSNCDLVKLLGSYEKESRDGK